MSIFAEGLSSGEDDILTKKAIVLTSAIKTHENTLIKKYFQLFELKKLVFFDFFMQN